jgi:hypothetical protein
MRQALADLRLSFTAVNDVLADMDSNVALALSNKAIASRYETTRCALAVVMSGFLESFLKDAASGFFRQVNARNKPFNSLPEAIRFNHFMHGAKVLHEAAKRERQGKTKPLLTQQTEALAARLASPNVASYEIVWEAFADTQANPGPQAVRDYLAKFGIEDSLHKVALRTKLPYSKKTIEVLLGSFMTLRNECAHTGTAATVPSTTYLRDTCDFIDEVAEAIVFLFEDLLANPPYV